MNEGPGDACEEPFDPSGVWECGIARLSVTVSLSGVCVHDPFGRPRGRMVDSIPNRFAIRLTQVSSPKGRPRCTLSLRDSSSNALSGRLIRDIQSRGRSTGQSLSQAASLASS